MDVCVRGKNGTGRSCPVPSIFLSYFFALSSPFEIHPPPPCPSCACGPPNLKHTRTRHDNKIQRGEGERETGIEADGVQAPNTQRRRERKARPPGPVPILMHLPACLPACFPSCLPSPPLLLLFLTATHVKGWLMLCQTGVFVQFVVDFFPFERRRGGKREQVEGTFFLCACCAKVGSEHVSHYWWVHEIPTCIPSNKYNCHTFL